MSGKPNEPVRRDWLEASGLLHFFRTLAISVQPAKLAIGLVAIVATGLFGLVLDTVWRVGGAGVENSTIEQFIRARELDVPFQEPEGDQGIFEVWRAHEERSVLGLMASCIPGTSLVAGTPFGALMQTHVIGGPAQQFMRVFYGVWWMMRFHTLFFVVFALGMLIIWSLAGGAICRLAALQFAREEKLTAVAGLTYARRKLLGGFLLAPCIPLVIIGVTSFLMILGGAVLRVWIIGDVIAGLAFPLAIVGGFVISLMLLGLLVGGGLFFPAVAVEGSDAFDAFSRGLSYPFSRAWKWVLYAAILLVYGSVCWVFVNLFTFVMLKVTRGIVSFGTSPFGWWARSDGDNPASKLELLWPMSGPGVLYAWPDWSGLAWYEYISAALIGVSVLIVAGLMWSFLVSFYFSGSTIMYFLLRRDVDGTDLEDVCIEDDEEDFAPTDAAPPGRIGPETAAPAPAPAGGAGATAGES